MSALCAYTQYIACIGLFKHCKRIHSTESYFQKVALCIIYIYFLFFFLPHPQRSQLRISMCLLAPGRAPLVCVSETWPSVWYHVTGHWQAANQCCSTANTPLSTTRLDGVLCVPHFANCEYDCESINRLSQQSKTEFEDATENRRKP